jgi:predicted dinucleotide-binding enzyme
MRNFQIFLSLLSVLLLYTSPVFTEERYKIAVIGTGNMGSALGINLAKANHTVIYGSRDPAQEKLKQLLQETGDKASVLSQKDAAQQGEIIILAVPWVAVESLIPTLGDLSGKIIIDITTGDRQGDDGYPEMAVETSTSELIQKWAPNARIVKTPFAGAPTVRNPLKYGEPTITYLAADDKEAKEVVAKLAIELNFFPMDAGPLRMARTLDHLAFLYLTPMIQGRKYIFRQLNVPRMDPVYSCMNMEGWFGAVSDAGNLAEFPNLNNSDLKCPERDSQ